MKIEELIALMETTNWNKIGDGSYNTVYVSVSELTIDGITQRWIKKVPKDPDFWRSQNLRAIRKFKEINGLPAYELPDNTWIAPYLGNTIAPDKEISEAMIDIYRRTRNLIVDGGVTGNFLLYKGKAICVDVDYAQSRLSISISEPDYLDYPYFNDHLILNYPTRPLTLDTLLSLKFLDGLKDSKKILAGYITPAFIDRITILRKIHLLTQDTLLIKCLFNIPEKHFMPLLRKLELVMGRDITLTRESLNKAIDEFNQSSNNSIEFSRTIGFETWDELNLNIEDNQAYLSKDEFTIKGRHQRWMLIKCLEVDEFDEFDNSARVVNKWNLLNPDNLAYEVTENQWLAPYFGDMLPSDDQIVAAVIDIYLRTRNLALEAHIPGSFILHDGKAKCIRMTCVRSNYSLDQLIPELWDINRIEGSFADFMHQEDHQKTLRKTISIVKTINYLEQSLAKSKLPLLKDEYITLETLEKAKYLRINGLNITFSLMNLLMKTSEDNLLHLIPKLVILQKKLYIEFTSQIGTSLLNMLELGILDKIPDEHLCKFIQIETKDHKKFLDLAKTYRLTVITKILQETGTISQLNSHPDRLTASSSAISSDNSAAAGTGLSRKMPSHCMCMDCVIDRFNHNSSMPAHDASQEEVNPLKITADNRMVVHHLSFFRQCLKTVATYTLGKEYAKYC